MLQLPRRTYNISSEKTKTELLCGLVDILFGCCYDHRMTSGDSTTESNWTIFIQSRCLSWLDPPTNVSEAVLSNIRRCLCYPYMRCWSFAQLCLLDVETLLRKGARPVLKMMLQAREIFAKSESRYLLNRLWLDDYCVWLQCGVDDAVLRQFAKEYRVARTSVGKKNFDATWKLNMIEKCFADMKIVAQAKAEGRGEESSSDDEDEESSDEEDEEEEEEEEKGNKEEKTKKVLIEEL